MNIRTDGADLVIAVAGQYYKAMINSDVVALKDVFHPGASVVGNLDGVLEFSNLDEFIASTSDAKVGEKPFNYCVKGLVLVGDTAVITIGGYSYGTWFTDHLSVVKIEGRWRIVCKTFHAHEAE